jgi:membrane associated rhomboid family serine protease
MFLIPLGLQARTRDFPWMTLLIAVVTSVYSVFSFQHLNNMTSSEEKSEASLARFQKQKSLALAACPISQLQSDDCELLKKTLLPEVRESTRAFITRLLKNESKISQEKATELARFVISPETFRHPSAAISQLKEFNDFAEALADEDQMLRDAVRKGGLLTRSSFGLAALVRSLFLHANWSHLLGNMVFFMLFAIPLEQRIGPMALALIYFIGGSFGMTLQLWLSSDMTRPLLGASACITAVAAAFMIAFWSISVRVWVSFFFIFNQIVRVPTWMFFALFMVIEDVTGALRPAADGVAHVAHLGGFGLGIILGLLAVQLRLIPQPFVFPFELKILLRSRQELDPERRLIDLREILYFNSFNTVALSEAWAVIEKLETKVWAELPRAAKVFLAEHYCELLVYFKKADIDKSAALLEFARLGRWPAKLLVAPKDLGEMLQLVSEFERQNHKGVQLKSCITSD